MRRLCACTLLLAAAACGGRDAAPPVATPSFSASKTRVPLGSPVDFTYAFDVASDARIEGDYTVFVHFLDADGQLMWTDDHTPVVPTSQWQPGQKVQYTRTVFVPIFPYHGPATVTIGLYNGPSFDDRLPLAGQGSGREYVVGTIDLAPQSEAVYVVFDEGWHSPELAPDGSAREWHWMTGAGTLTFRNPRKDVTLYLEFDGQPQVFGDAPQTLVVMSGGHEIARLPVDNSDAKLHRLPITAAQLGDGEKAQVRLTVDKTFVPASTPDMGVDPRELGVRVYRANIEVE